MVLDHVGPWIVFRLLGWLSRLGRLRLGCRWRGSGFIGFGNPDRRIADGGTDVVGVEFEAAALLPRLGLPVALHESSGDDDPGSLANAGRNHVIRQRTVCDAADERRLAILPSAVPLGDAGLRHPEGDDGLASGCPLGFKVFDDVAHDGHGDLVDCRHGSSFLFVDSALSGGLPIPHVSWLISGSDELEFSVWEVWRIRDRGCHTDSRDRSSTPDVRARPAPHCRRHRSHDI